MSKIRTGLVLGALATVFCAGAAFASGGTVKLKTDNTADGYYYNALGNAAARYGAFYNSGEFDINAVICGVRYRERDQSVITAGVDGYVLGLDLRSEDPNAATYADLTGGGLIAAGDANSVASCSTTGAARTGTFGGGAGTADPLTSFLITMAQPANNDPADGSDFCGILLDTSSVFVNSARTQGYAPGGALASIGFNHFVEAVVFEPKEFDLSIRMTGSSRFAGDRGLPVQFARRKCSGTDCKVDGTDGTGNDASDDFISGRFTIDNNTLAAPRPLNLIVEADRSAINPKLGPKDVTNFFKPIGGGGPIMNPVTFPNGRTLFKLEIKIAIKRKFLASFPVNLPFDVRLEDPNDANDVPDSESQALGLRSNTGYYDDNSHSGGFFFSQSPVLTGDALSVRFDAVDLPKVGNTLNITGAEVVAGEFGASGLAGLDAFELRREDAVLANNPDLSPQGLLRNIGVVGDPGNADGIATGLPVTTVPVDFTNYVATPVNAALALNLFGMAYLSPGDTGAAVTAVGSAGGGDVFIGNSSTLNAGVAPVAAFNQDDLEIRLDVEGELGTSASAPQTKVIDSVLREQGRVIAVEKGGRRID
jgi:hypothetical protein